VFRCLSIRKIAGILLVLLLPITAWAQETEEMAPWSQVRIIDVKRDQLAEWEELAKEIIAASAEAGLPPVAVFEEVRGTMNRFHVVQALTDLAQLDDPAMPMSAEEMEEWASRIAKTEATHRVLIVQNYPQYAVEGEEDMESSGFLMLRVVSTAPGHAQDYESWIADTLVPALREANLPHSASRGFLGANVNTWYHALPVANWAEFDGPNPLMQALGEEAFMKLIEGVDAMVSHHKAILLRLRPDLSSPME